MVGCVVIGMLLPLFQVFQVAAVPLLFSAIVSFALGRVALNSVPVYETRAQARSPAQRSATNAGHFASRRKVEASDASHGTKIRQLTFIVLGEARRFGRRYCATKTSVPCDACVLPMSAA